MEYFNGRSSDILEKDSMEDFKTLGTKRVN